ncbi:MAG: hypothetical protein GXX85_00470 [Ignavibacteria bacterium]|nr:hypothetical protein [Ignavibacteria bacterium]
MKIQTTRNYIEDYIAEVQSNGKLHFSLEDLKNRFNSNYQTAIKFSLNKLFKKGRLVSIYKGFYVIIPPEYKSRKILPAEMFVDALFNYLKRPYYLGLLSAAVFHGASHQQVMESYVVINKPSLRSTETEGLKINYLVKSGLPEFGIERRKTEVGFINISCPELTALDLIQYLDRIGGLNRASTVLYELTESMNVEKLNEVLKNKIPLSRLQRTGYIFDKVLNKKDLAEVIHIFLKDKIFFRTPLKTGLPKEQCKVNSDWKIIENFKIETDFY